MCPKMIPTYEKSFGNQTYGTEMCSYKINGNLFLLSCTVQLTKNAFKMLFVVQAFIVTSIFTYGCSFRLDQNVPFIIGRFSWKFYDTISLVSLTDAAQKVGSLGWWISYVSAYRLKIFFNFY